MKTLGVGIIGFGFIGKVHAYAYRNMPLFYDPPPLRTKLVGVATAHPDTAEKGRLQCEFEWATTDWRELVAHPDVDIINICSPNSQHAAQIIAAAAAGKHIYCDKPLVVSDGDAASVGTALAAYQGVGQITLQNRFLPATMRARELVEAGFLGNVISFRGAYLHAGNADATAPLRWKHLAGEGGGVLQDIGSHLVDLMDYLCGPFAEISATLRTLHGQRPDGSGINKEVDTDDQALLMVRLRNGALGTLEASKIATGAEDELRFEIHGDKGALRFNLMDTNYLEAWDGRAPGSPHGGDRGWRRIACSSRAGGTDFPTPKASVGWLPAHVHCLHHFLQAIAAGSSAEPSLQRGLWLQRVLAAAQLSHRERRWVDLLIPADGDVRSRDR